MVHMDIGVHKVDRQLRTLWHQWSSGWDVSNAVRGSINYIYLPPLHLAHRASCTNNGYRSRIPNGPLNGWGVLPNLRVQR
jgi:hypothetical protein